MLGLTKKQIENKFNDIIAFSGVEKFIDMPVKHYSSGMYVRLAFSVVANIDADILLFDEVLNVGDSEFQQSCLKKILELTSSNKTVILVSHNMNDILHLCNRVLYIEKGKIDYEGSANTSVSNYIKSFEKAINTQLNANINNRTLEKINLSLEDKGLRIISLVLFQKGETVNNAIDFNAPFEIAVKFEKYNTNYQINFSYSLIHYGNVFLSSNSIYAKNGQRIIKEKGIFKLSMEFPQCLLNESVYQVDFYISFEETDETFQIKSALEFTVKEFNVRSSHKIFNVYNKFPGPLNPSLEWKLIKHNDEN
jgi:lipopolysaccharide transport system ATP-binding protein